MTEIPRRRMQRLVIHVMLLVLLFWIALVAVVMGMMALPTAAVAVGLGIGSAIVHGVLLALPQMKSQLESTVYRRILALLLHGASTTLLVVLLMMTTLANITSPDLALFIVFSDLMTLIPHGAIVAFRLMNQSEDAPKKKKIGMQPMLTDDGELLPDTEVLFEQESAHGATP